MEEKIGLCCLHVHERNCQIMAGDILLETFVGFLIFQQVS